MKKSSQFVVFLILTACLAGCASTELTQVSSLAEEHQINTPEQSKRLIEENSR